MGVRHFLVIKEPPSHWVAAFTVVLRNFGLDGEAGYGPGVSWLADFKGAFWASQQSLLLKCWCSARAHSMKSCWQPNHELLWWRLRL